MGETIQARPAHAGKSPRAEDQTPVAVDPVVKELTSGMGPSVEDAADVDAAQHWQQAAREAARARGLLVALPVVPRVEPRRLWRALVRREQVTRLLLALVMAVLLWLYVMGLENPAQAAVYPSLPIQVRGLTQDLDVRNDLGSATVNVHAPQEVLARTHAGDFTVYVDVTGMGPGTQAVPVQVLHPPEISDLQVSPDRVTVQIGQHGTATLPVQARAVGQPNTGYEVETPQVQPVQVTVSGPQEQVDRIARVVAEMDVEGRQGTQTGDIRPRALDANGREIPNLTFDPPTVRVAVAIKLLLDFKTLALHVPLDGDPAPGFRVTDISVQPTTVIVQGQPALLASLNILDTAPVSIAGVTETVTSQITVALPPGVTLSSNQPAQATVRIQVEEMTTSMTISARVRLSGMEPGLDAVLSPDRVEVRLSGSFEALQNIDLGSLQAAVDLTGRGAGTYYITPVVTAPAGTRVIGLNPTGVTVTIAAPLPTPAPTVQPLIVITPTGSPVVPSASLTPASLESPVASPTTTPGASATLTPAATPTPTPAASPTPPVPRTPTPSPTSAHPLT